MALPDGASEDVSETGFEPELERAIHRIRPRWGPSVRRPAPASGRGGP
jgi:hypothetical protein